MNMKDYPLLVQYDDVPSSRWCAHLVSHPYLSTPVQCYFLATETVDDYPFCAKHAAEVRDWLEDNQDIQQP